ncbi:MAG TPA: hypothetical protein VHX65_14160 [Pirellulales bacterium]|jgi:hypothetical protein|nr:hypothetical protein [Pirellulales bacterium]
MLPNRLRVALRLIFGSCVVWACLAATIALAADPDVLDAIKPGEWYEVPNSHLDAVAPSDKEFPWLRGNVGGVIDCWAGGAFDTQRDRLYIGPGGGHAGYNGNEVYAFELHDLRWHRLTDPDPVIPGTEYTDLEKSPFAMHTYDAVEYLPPPVDRYVVIGGWGTPRAYALDPDHPKHWEVYPDHRTGRTGDYCAYDPVKQLLWLNTPITSGKLSQWNPFSHQWTLRLHDSPEPSYYETADIDFRRHLLVACGRGKSKITQLKDVPAVMECRTVETSGDRTAEKMASPGFCYVPALDKFVAWAGGADVYTLDIDTLHWTRHAPAPTNRVSPGPQQQWGTFGRFRYIPSRNLFIVCSGVKQNVFLYRLTAERPNPIVSVVARASRKSIERSIPATPLVVEAVYADGRHVDVTRDANYQSLDPNVASVEPRGGGIVVGRSLGTTQIRATYCDPAYKRGFSSGAEIGVDKVSPAPTLQSLKCDAARLTMVPGESFQLLAAGRYSRASDHFKQDETAAATWSSDSPEVVSVARGLVRAIKSGATVDVRVALDRRSAVVKVDVTDKPQIRRISFQVKETPVRPGWLAETGQKFSDHRGYGWLDNHDISARDDRASAHHPMLMHFNTVLEKAYKVRVPRGDYTVRIAMGDADYGKVPFEGWTALGDRRLIYYEGRDNSIATRRVSAGDDGLVFTVNGPINYLIVVPLGIDIEKHADDGPEPR